MPDPSQFNSDRTYPGRWTITFSNPLIMSIATAVPPCTPNATVLLPPWCNTITASATGMRVAASMNQLGSPDVMRSAVETRD